MERLRCCLWKWIQPFVTQRFAGIAEVHLSGTFTFQQQTCVGSLEKQENRRALSGDAVLEQGCNGTSQVELALRDTESSRVCAVLTFLLWRNWPWRWGSCDKKRALGILWVLRCSGAPGLHIPCLGCQFHSLCGGITYVVLSGELTLLDTNYSVIADVLAVMERSGQFCYIFFADCSKRRKMQIVLKL